MKNSHASFYTFILTGLFAIFSGLSFAQINLNNFTALRSSGPVPADFIRFCGQQPPDYVNKKEKTIAGVEKFEMISDYHLNQMFQSGKVVFGDPIGIYINAVADSLLADYPALRKEIRFYVCNSEVANAYASDQGIIFVNIGLIAHLENEAQLAFILAHEITHYAKKHNMTIFNEKEELLGKKKKEDKTDKENYELRRKPMSEKLMTINHWSKEIETIADVDGFASYYRSSPYNLEEAVNAFNVLLYSDYPFTQASFNFSVMEADEMIIPDAYLLTSVDELTVDENEADSMSTHPNVNKRKTSIRNLMDTISDSGGVLFAQSQETFFYVRNLARFECVRQMIIGHDFVEALYCAVDLADEFPNSRFLVRCIAASLYGLSAYKESGEANEIYGQTGEVKGEMKQVSFFVKRIVKRDWAIIALNYCWRQHQRFPDDKYLAGLADRTMYSVIFENHISASWFYTKTFAQVIKEKEMAGPQEKYETDKYGIKHLKVDQFDTTFTKFAFVDLLKDSTFSKALNKMSAKKDSLQKVYVANINPFKPYGYIAEEKIDKADRAYVDHIVMGNPWVVNVDARKGVKLQYVQTTHNQYACVDQIPEAAADAEVKVDLVNTRSIEQTGAEQLNQVAIINEYMEERLLQTKDFVLLSFNSDEIKPVMDKYDSHHLGWTAMVSYKVKKPVGALIFASMFVITIPITVYRLIQPAYKTYYLHFLYNVNTSKLTCRRVKAKDGSILKNGTMKSNLRSFFKYAHKQYEKKK